MPYDSIWWYNVVPTCLSLRIILIFYNHLFPSALVWWWYIVVVYALGAEKRGCRRQGLLTAYRRWWYRRNRHARCQRWFLFFFPYGRTGGGDSAESATAPIDSVVRGSAARYISATDPLHPWPPYWSLFLCRSCQTIVVVHFAYSSAVLYYSIVNQPSGRPNGGGPWSGAAPAPGLSALLVCCQFWGRSLLFTFLPARHRYLFPPPDRYYHV